ncbi:hypothetical protein [Spirosoma montaniterrae]|uniref:Uncharacterized protein n=1 Tax=Spirosoma montaniterrae TaxID=1178516 RepID=A0A1P9WXE4_9BACT|nr:hypothetical protein [Spirosoma montaniterrae]AQG80066.1 hypothetical protein AWR27_12460 [Spirosoma montaniterrae]
MTSLEFNKDTLFDLADQTHEHSISIFIPTHRRGQEVLEGHDQIAFKNHLQAIRLELEKSVRSNDIDTLMEPLDALLADQTFWRYRTEGLAVFRNPAYFATFDSPTPLSDAHYLQSKFWLRPLLPYVQPARQYCILQIGKNGALLYKADPYSISQVDAKELMPSGIDEITVYYDFEEELQGRTKGRGGMAAIYTSDDANREQKEKDHLLADYFRLIDGAIMSLIGTQNVPLLLASVEYYQPIYRLVNSYPHLHEQGLTGNFDHVQAIELHEMANQLLTDYFEQSYQRRLTQYQNQSGTDQTATDLRSILDAAVTGRIESLFIQADAQAWGHFDEATLTATLHDERQEGDQSLIDQAALLTLRNGGDVFVVDEGITAGQQPPVHIAALYRF